MQSFTLKIAILINILNINTGSLCLVSGLYFKGCTHQEGMVLLLICLKIW